LIKFDTIRPVLLRLIVDDIRLSWDLLILVFFAVVMAYSFIIGENTEIKVIISAYMAVLTADGMGSLIENYMFPSAPSLQGAAGDETLILLKMFLFVLVIVLLVIKGGYRVDLLPKRSLLTRLLTNLTFGFLCAGLLVSTLLVYLTGGSFATGTITAAIETNLYQESLLVQLLIDNYSVWFALPAIAIVVVSFFEPREA
jgi:hypothetical protein